MINPSSFPVLALKALQKSMMFTPAWPSAGPTGGAGVALPAGICSLICPTTFFMTLELFHLQEIEFHRRRTAEDRHHHLERVLVEVHFLDHTLEVRERTVDDAHVLAALEGVLGLRLVDRLLDLDEDLVRLLGRERDRAVSGADEARDLGRVLDE